jgi:hypothetical protein
VAVAAARSFPFRVFSFPKEISLSPIFMSVPRPDDLTFILNSAYNFRVGQELDITGLVGFGPWQVEDYALRRNGRFLVTAVNEKSHTIEMRASLRNPAHQPELEPF